MNVNSISKGKKNGNSSVSQTCLDSGGILYFILSFPLCG